MNQTKKVLMIFTNSQYVIENCEFLCRIFEEPLGFYDGSNDIPK